MGDFVDTMKLVEKAREDIYFAKINRELIEELHRRAAAEVTARLAKQGNPERKDTPCSRQ
jgi:hypothetical protein